MLIEHRIDDVHEGLVAAEEAVAAGQQIAFEPALTLVLAQHFHGAPVVREMRIGRADFGRPHASGHLEHIVPAIRSQLIRAEDAEIRSRQIQLHDIADVGALDARRFGVRATGLFQLDCILAEVRQPQAAQQDAAVGVRIVAHAALALGCELAQLRSQPALAREQLLGSIAAHPLFQQAQVPALLRELRQRHLMRAPTVFDGDAVDFARTRPSLRRVQHERGPSRALVKAVAACGTLDLANARDDAVERARHREMRRLVARLVVDVKRLVAVAAQQLRQLLARNAREHGRARDLVAVEMQDRQDGAIAHRVEKLVRMPAGRERPGLRFAVADDAGDDEIRVVERGAMSVRQRVAELAAFVDRAGRFRRGVARDAAGEGELLEKPPQPVDVFRHVRVELAVRALEIGVRHHRRAAMPRPADIDHVQVVLINDAVQVRVDEVQPGRRAPVAEQARLDVLDRKRLRQQRIVEQINLSHRQIVGGAPVGVETRR